MKKYIFILVTGILMSCSSDFLNVSPNTSTSPNELYATTENAKAAVNGIAKLMHVQYNSQGFNGEGTIKMFYNNYAGQHFYKNLPGWQVIQDFEFTFSNTSVYNTYMWYYYYTLIGNSNSLIANIDAAEGPENQRQFIKAQGLTFRAYAYLQLSQIYGKRWIDTNNGDHLCLVLRLDESKGEMPLSSLADVYKQIYKDLDDAIKLYTDSNLKRGNNKFYEPDINVAYATYARAAITKGDNETAAKYAKLAYANFPLMDEAQYKAGFSRPNQEWIWGSYNAADESLYFWSFFAYMGYNSTANIIVNYPNCISRVLYNKIPDTDFRKELFLNPGDDYIPMSDGLLDSDNLNHLPLITEYRSKYPDLVQGSKMYRYMQFKFKNIEQPGVGNINHFRSSEMYLIEAEALYKLGKETEAQEVLAKLNKTRDPNYSTNATGTDLFDEIKTYRGIELWGEGFEWFDLKRWGDARIRNTFKVTDASTEEELPDELYDQFPISLAKTINPDEQNSWVYVTPNKEVDYNSAIK